MNGITNGVGVAQNASGNAGVAMGASALGLGVQASGLSLMGGMGADGGIGAGVTDSVGTGSLWNTGATTPSAVNWYGYSGTYA